MLVLVDVAVVSCFGILRRQTSLGDSCPKIVGSMEFGRNAPMSFPDRLVSEGALRSSAGCYHHVTRLLVLW
jgi:hypothetical protein